ncbi:methanol/ethanol family PQQ-dependent dehydrogenase [Geminicoccus flavidas]|uniref:methanol/ethanol family PQQ-dependent dehydrogenase n=1 Tax=Geminicoccus flavidas TaxID=2506407 RepID=UPI0013584DC4|nr:methanol/ethanol family PQQ-dependent dehydrogenase [Geminicoccus flavidas]
MPVPPASAAPPDDGQWTAPAKNHANTRYSELDEIDTGNVARLTVAFTFSTGVNRGQESAPLVVGDTMYLVTPYPNILYALDLTKPGAPMKWRYEPKPAAAAQGVACCDVVNRGPTYADGRIFYTTLDGHVVAVDAATGGEVWKVRVGDINTGETLTMAPLVARDKVYAGNSGGEYGVRGWIQALSAEDGSTVWKAYNTGPDKDVLIGPEFKPFYAMDQGVDLGVTTWPPDAWQQGGGNVWGWLSFDPDLNLLYHGTGNPGPWNAELRPGDNKWTAGIFARDADSGAARWFYQFSPHDLYDWDGINENILLDLTWQGQPRKVLVRPERNGHVYVLDRTTGEVLSAEPFHHLTATRGVDLKTGRLNYVPEKAPQMNRVVRDICPTAPGAKDWNPSSFSHQTGLLYIPHNNLCMDWQVESVSYIAGTPYVGAEVRMYPGPGGHRGVLAAWDVANAKPVWEIPEKFPVWSGAITTAGGLVFYGTMDGWFKAVDARAGKVLWQFKTASGIIGQPTTYRGPDGHQYVAILSGVGGWAGSVVAADLDVRDGTAAKGFVNAMRDFPDATTKGGTLYVFKLP